MLRRLAERLLSRVWPGDRAKHSAPQSPTRGPLTHVIILDGTLSTLEAGHETNAGLTYRLLSEVGAPVSVYYESGLQMHSWRDAKAVLMGRGINRQIRRAYGYLASRYHPGDRIFLLGYSRGAFAVRSLAGVIDTVGLLRAHHATERNITQAYRYYQMMPGSPAARSFVRAHCHESVEIQMVGVWDTVKSLGLRLPLLWRWSEADHAFHNHTLGPSILHGCHALALDETRQVFEPVLWTSDDTTADRIEQVWFKGSHGDVGGQIGGHADARPLSNIPLVWMLEQAERAGLILPAGWRARFPCDPDAPSVGTWRDWGKLFLLRRRRRVGLDPSERYHETALHADAAVTLRRQAG